MSITTEEVNLMIFRYLQETAHEHSAFTFAHEARLARSSVALANIPPGLLVELLQKGLQYAEMEREIVAGNTDPEVPKPPAGLTTIFNASPRSASYQAELQSKSQAESGAGASSAAMKDDEDDTSEAEASKRIQSLKLLETSPVVLVRRPMSSVAAVCGTDGSIVTVDTGASDRKSTIIRLQLPDRPAAVQASVDAMRARAVAAASGSTASKAGTAAASGASSSSSAAASSSSTGAAQGALDAVSATAFDEVTDLSWSPDGKYIAAAAADGRVVAWQSDSKEAAATMIGHSGPCMGAQFSATGAYLGSYGSDGRVVIWDPDDWTRHSVVSVHGAAVLGFGWQTDSVFATCSADRMVYLHRLGNKKPIRTFQGHGAAVTTMEWDGGRSLLATGSDDTSVRIWSPKEGLVAWLTGHAEEIADISWSPVGFDGKKADKTQQPAIASCSFDGSVRLWDAKSGRCSARIAAHSSMACSVAFSPTGATIASGGADGDLVISSLADGRIAARIHLDAPVHSVMWDGRDADRAIAALSDGTIACVNLRAGKAE